MYIYIYVYTYIFLDIYTHIRKHVYVYIYIYMYMYTSCPTLQKGFAFFCLPTNFPQRTSFYVKYLLVILCETFN